MVVIFSICSSRCLGFCSHFQTQMVWNRAIRSGPSQETIELTTRWYPIPYVGEHNSITRARKVDISEISLVHGVLNQTYWIIPTPPFFFAPWSTARIPVGWYAIHAGAQTINDERAARIRSVWPEAPAEASRLRQVEAWLPTIHTIHQLNSSSGHCVCLVALPAQLVMKCENCWDECLGRMIYKGRRGLEL